MKDTNLALPSTDDSTENGCWLGARPLTPSLIVELLVASTRGAGRAS